jgi:hypothetical protein
LLSGESDLLALCPRAVLFDLLRQLTNAALAFERGFNIDHEGRIDPPRPCTPTALGLPVVISPPNGSALSCDEQRL